MAKQQASIEVWRQAERDTYVQFMTDVFLLMLNDPDIMGKDVFGQVRVGRICEHIQEYVDEYGKVLKPTDDQDYYQFKMDERLKRIVGAEKFRPFEQRYSWLKKPK